MAAAEAKTIEDVPQALAALDGLGVGRFHLVLRACRRHRLSGWRRFALHLQLGSACSERPVLHGLFSCGGKGVAGWFDCEYAPCVRMSDGASLDLRGSADEVALFAALSRVLPPDGHVMVACESAMHEETFAALNSGVPPAATPLGAALWRAGLTGGFKYWYFAEGGWEGPIKLQANKPRGAGDTAAVAKRVKEELRAYLARPPSDRYPEIQAAARERALHILRELP